MSFRSVIRYFRPEKASGLAVADLPADQVAALGGLKQLRVHGTINGVAYASNVMPSGGGRLALSLSKAMLKSANVQVGDEAEFEVERL